MQSDHMLSRLSRVLVSAKLFQGVLVNFQIDIQGQLKRAKMIFSL